MSHVTTDGPGGLVIDESAIDQLQRLNLYLVTDGETVILVSAENKSAAIGKADKAHVLHTKTVHWVC